MRLPEPKSDVMMFSGGYDTETPVWKVPSGTLRNSLNYEIGINDGYADIQGYESYDGSPAPSDATYYTLDVTITGEFSVGDTITGVDSSSTAVVLAVVTSGAQAYLVITKRSAGFNASENLEVSASVEGNTDAVEAENGASTHSLHADYQNLAADEYRGDIDVVAGSGDVTGFFVLNDIRYAIRNVSGDATAAIFKNTSSGWTLVALGRQLPFTAGDTSYTIAEGDVIEGESSGATATLTRVMTESGAWGTDAAGKFIFASQSGTFQSETVKVGANLSAATIAADSTAITLAPNSPRLVWDKSNFGGEAGTERIYGADGVSRGFEFDGTVFCPIDTGMTTDTPTQVIVHENQLFFSYAGSAQHSGLSTPYIFTPIFGASEIAVGDTITGFVSEAGAEGNGALAIYSSNAIHMLYGNDTTDWNLVRYRREVGAFKYTPQQLSTTLFLHDRGVTNLRTVQAFGNFVHSTLSDHIQEFIIAKRTLATASCIVRDKNQYRIFFTDKYALYVTMDGNKVRGMMPVLFDHEVTCMASVELNDGSEAIYFGSTDGKVYQLDKGTSFDGANIVAFWETHFAYAKMLRVLKKYLNHVTLEISGTGYAEFAFTFDLGYADTNIPQPNTVTETATFAASDTWDAAGLIWDTLFWDAQSVAPTTNLKLSGSAENISFIVRKDSDKYEPVTFTGAHYSYLPRRRLR